MQSTDKKVCQRIQKNALRKFLQDITKKVVFCDVCGAFMYVKSNQGAV